MKNLMKRILNSKMLRKSKGGAMKKIIILAVALCAVAGAALFFFKRCQADD